MNEKVDRYLEDGCGRCKFYLTPECKVHNWTKELQLLRRIVLDCGLEEEFKWSQPTYTLKKKNVLMITALRESAVLAFFKGSLLKDEAGLLVAPGKNSQSDRQFRFNSIDQINEAEAIIKAYIFEAIDIEKAGKKVVFKKNPEPVPTELKSRFDKDPSLKAAFENLTPGRQRGYILYFSQPKQAKTRESRIDKNIGRIMNGKGIHDRD